MRLVGTLLLFGGYVLVYASVANGGKFATEPWAGLFTDAYDVQPNLSATPGAGGTPGVSGSPKPLRPRKPPVVPTAGQGASGA